MSRIKKPGIGRLIVQKVPDEQKTDAGLLIVDTFESPTQRCKVLYVGTQLKDEYPINSYVYIPRHSGYEIDFEELLIAETEILFSTAD